MTTSNYLAERALQISAAAKQREIDRKADLRRRMPLAAAEVDKIRAFFGPPPYGRLTENGQTVTWGRPSRV